MISRNTALILSPARRPFPFETRARIWLSRSGRYAAPPALSSPIFFACAARRSMSAASSSSSRSISSRILSSWSDIYGKIAYREDAVEGGQILDDLVRDRTVGVDQGVGHLAPRLVQHVVDVDLAPAERVRNAAEHVGHVG